MVEIESAAIVFGSQVNDISDPSIAAVAISIFMLIELRVIGKALEAFVGVNIAIVEHKPELLAKYDGIAAIVYAPPNQTVD